jgi:hypothetical protein
MRSLAPVFLILAVVCVGSANAAEPPILVRVEVADRTEAREVGRILNLEEKTRGNVLYGWGTIKEIEAVERLGFLVEVAPPESRNLEALTMCADPITAPFPWNCYPTWTQYETMMNHYATSYPGIARLVNLGTAGSGTHELWALKISDNPDLEENEPEVLYTGAMHGDELVCYPTTIHLIDHILANYGSDTQVTRLVDESVLWFNPMSNPDGTFAGGDSTVAGATRSLPTSGVDANRSFPDPAVPDDPTSPGWPTEVQVMMDFAATEHLTISANCHAGAELFNYPWDVWTYRAPDDQWWIDAGIAYASSAQTASPGSYFVDFGSGFDYPGVTNGANWYVIDGGRQDFMNWYHGCREVTLELASRDDLDANLLDDHFDWNRQALLDYFDLALTGIRGVVTDAVSGQPLTAEIRVVGHDIEEQRSWVSTDPDVGDYHRLIEPGTYDLEVSAVGYLTAQASGVTVVSGTDATVQDFALTALTSHTVSGLVTDAVSGAGLAGATVTLLDTAFPPAVTGANGAYTIPDVWEGSYTFRVEAAGYGATEADLVVDAVATTHDFTLAPLVVVLEDDFELSDGDLIPSAGWAWGSDSTAGANSGVSVWGTVLNGDYQSNVQWTLDTPVVDLPGGDGAELRYWQWYDIESGWDGGRIEVSVDGGAFVRATPSPDYNDQTIYAFGDTPGFTGVAGWHEVVVDLTPFAGQSVVVRWTLGTDSSVTSRGWYIDDLSVTAWGGDLSPEVFADDFESGDTGAWSRVAGGAVSTGR